MYPPTGVTMVQPPPMAQAHIFVPPGGPPQTLNNNTNPNYVYPGGPPGATSNNMNPPHTNNPVVRGTYVATNNHNNNVTTSVVVGVPL